MKYGDIRRAVLSRVRMYSIAGVEIPASYNLQADELGRIPLLINEALFHILTAVRRERETVELTGGEAWHGMVRFPLPEDVYALPLGRVWVRRSGKLRPAPGCRFVSRCPYASDKCKENPQWHEVEENHFVFCHLYE